MKVLVTGGGGFLGLGLCTALTQRGYQVSSLQRSYSPALDALGVKQFLGDISDIEIVLAATPSIDCIFHNAAKAGHWGSYDSYYRPNVLGTKNILNACRQHNIQRLIYTSSPSVCHNARIPCAGGNEDDTPYAPQFKAHYPATKMLAEQLVRAANDQQLATVSLRPRLIWGPGDNNLLPRLVARARSGRLRLIAGGSNLLDTTYIDNAVDAHLQAFDALHIGSRCSGRAYFISNAEPKSAKQIINSLLTAAGQDPINSNLPFGLAYAIGAACELIWPTFKLASEPPLTRFVVEQLSTNHWYDISAAQRDFGYQPRISFEQGLQQLQQWWAQRE